VLLYLLQLTGVIFFAALAGAVLQRKKYIGMFFAFLVPAVLTFTLSMGPDITVNHKWLMMSVALINIFAAYAIVMTAEFFIKKQKIIFKAAGFAIAGILILLLTSSGIVDTFAYKNRNGPGRKVVYEALMRGTTGWIYENTPPRSVFLSDWHVQSPILLAGRFVFFGWPYFGGGAGHDTHGRGKMMQVIFASQTPEELRYRLKANGISYIYVDNGLVNNREFGFNGEIYKIISATFPLVYENAAEGVRIYNAAE
jgi:hypothetical protein